MRVFSVAGVGILLILGVLGVWDLSFGVRSAFGEEPARSEDGVSPPPERVHLYPSGAGVEIPVPAGAFLVRLPATFDLSRIRLQLPEGNSPSSPPDIVLLPRAEWIPPALKTLSEKVGELRAEVAVLDAEAASLRQLTGALESLKPEGEKALDLLVAAAELRREQELRLAEVTETLQRKRHEAELWNRQLQERLQEGYSMVIEVRGDGGRGGGLLTAWTDQVHWTYRYVLNLETKSGNVTGRLVASVMQRTGIDWDGPLVVHTADPPRLVRPPRLRPLVVDIAQPRQDDFRAKGAVPDAAPAPYMAVEEIALGSTPAPPVREEGLRGVDILTTGRVPGEGTSTEIPLGDLALQGSMAIVLVPRFSQEAWLLAEVETLPEAVLPGEAELSVDGVAGGKTTLPARSKGQDLTVAFGATPLVRVEREKSVGVEGKSWLGKGRLADGYELTVTNGLPSETVVRILERVPVSANESVKVEIKTMDPQPASSDREGLLSWEIPLKSGEIRKIAVHYTLTYPGDKDLVFRDK